MSVEFAEVVCVILMPIVIYLLYLLMFGLISVFSRQFATRQKTREPPQRRMYVGSRARTSLPPAEPTIYVTPAHLPPPPKYEAMAPPSYEEVVGVHYPNYQPPHMQPITQPITTAVAQGSSNSTETTDNVTNNDEDRAVSSPSAVITVTSEERRTSVTVATS